MPGQLVADDFNRADGALGANWTKPTGVAQALTIVSNKAGTTASATTFGAVYTGAGWTGGPDQYAELAITTHSSVNDGGPSVRMGTGAEQGYVLDINFPNTVALGGSMLIGLYSNTGGVFTLLTSTTMVISANDVLRIEAQDTTIRGKVNGTTVLSAVSGAYMTGSPGVRWFNGAAARNVEFDNFAAGDFLSTFDQEGFRFRNDDGSETTATWKAAQDTNASYAADTTFRLRTLVNAAGDAPSKRFKLQYRKVGDAEWRDIDTIG